MSVFTVYGLLQLPEQKHLVLVHDIPDTTRAGFVYSLPYAVHICSGYLPSICVVLMIVQSSREMFQRPFRISIAFLSNKGNPLTSMTTRLGTAHLGVTYAVLFESFRVSRAFS